jgi:FkbM family methyltransferase
MLGIRGAIREKLFSLEGSAFAKAFNVANTVYWRFPIVLSWRENGRYLVTDADTGQGMVFARKERVFVYRRGVRSRLTKLGEIYSVDKCQLAVGDLVIDCGANVGEFSSLVCAQYGCHAIAIEPEHEEAACIGENATGVRAVIEKALWTESGAIKLYSKNKSADSSIFETQGYEDVKVVPAVSLDDVFALHQIDHVKLLKLEAEGAEPEVLCGARKALTRISYIAADLGPERGVEQQSTVAPVCNVLLSSGFEMVSVYPKRQVYLFRNTSLT